MQMIRKNGVYFFVFLFLIFMPDTSFAAQKDISGCSVVLSSTSFVYNGEVCRPEVTVKDGETVLREGIDYVLFGAFASTVGRHEITIAGTGNYTGETTASFEIVKAQNKISIGSNVFYTYSQPKELDLYIHAGGNAKLSYSTNTEWAWFSGDGLLSVKDGFLGTVIVYVTSAETKYYHAASASFPVEVKLLGTEITEITNEDIFGLPDDDHTVCVHWNAYNMEIQSVGGFQIRYSKDPNFQSNVHKTKIPMLNGMGHLVSSCIMNKNLVKGDRVYFQIRTYKEALDGKMYYSEWSDTVAHDIDSSPEAYYRGKYPKNGKVYVDEGIRYRYKNGTLAVCKKQTREWEKKIVIPAKASVYGKKYPVTSIEKGAFKGFSSAREIVIGKNIKKIGANAFKEMRWVEKITIKSTKLKEKSIGKNAFCNTGGDYSFSEVKLKTPKPLRAKYIKILRKKGIRCRIK